MTADHTQPAPCYPSQPRPVCYHCARRRLGNVPREHRMPVIDASRFFKDAICPMFRVHIKTEDLT
jgi:hypothetical protein